MRAQQPGRVAASTRLPVTSVTRTGPDQVSVVRGGVTVAQADVVPGPRVVVRFWVATLALTADTRAELVRAAFAHEALGPRQQVLATVPHAATALVCALQDHITVTHTHASGATSMVEGRVT